jgi:hypothetical protein
LASPWWQFLLFSNSGVNIDIDSSHTCCVSPLWKIRCLVPSFSSNSCEHLKAPVGKSLSNSTADFVPPAVSLANLLIP